jgi:tripartite-type tricarboxylate transporter receptor subunit TctC
LGLLAGLAACATAYAQNYPSKPVRLVVPMAAGGIQDTLSRAIALEMTGRWGQPLIVENRAGANGIVGCEFVARSAPDGYTILMANSTALSIDLLPESRGLSFDPVKDFTPVIALVNTGNILVTSPQFPANTLQELIALTRQKPGEFNYGSFGIGSSPHLDTEALATLSGLRLTHIPYKGGSQIVQAVLAGEVTFSIMGLQSAVPLIHQGRLKAIAYGGLQRSALLPEVPTLSESGFKGFESGGWFGWLVPAATPKGVVERIAADASALINTPAFRDKYILSAGFDILNLPSAAFAERLKANRETYAARLKGISIKQY